MKLLKILSNVKSKASSSGRKFKVESILALVILAQTCNACTISSIARFAERLSKPQKKVLGFQNGVPKKGTIYYTLKLIDLDSLSDALVGICIHKKEERIIDIDGKTIRGSRKQGSPAHHILSAFARENRMTISQKITQNAGQEIPAALRLMEEMQLKKDIIVGDAIFTQQEVVETIVYKDCYFVLNVKGNQKALLDAIHEAFHYPENTISRYTEEISKEHGRIEQRAIEVMDMPYNFSCAWRHIKQIAKIKRSRMSKKNGKWIEENNTAYIITNLATQLANPKRLLELNRGHWNIENKLNWVKDRVIREDESTVSDRRSASILAKVRDFVINRISQVSSNIKASLEEYAHKVQNAMILLKIY